MLLSRKPGWMPPRAARSVSGMLGLLVSLTIVGSPLTHAAQPQGRVQTTMVPAGGSAIVEFRLEVPRTYIIVDQALLRAFNKGALGMLKVEGPENKTIYSGKEVDSGYLVDKATVDGAVERATAAAVSGTLTLEAQTKAGETLFAGTCSVCHQSSGEGLPGYSRRWPSLISLAGTLRGRSPWC